MVKKAVILLVILSIFLLTTSSYTVEHGTSCTNFSAVSGEAVLFGNNEDASGDHPLRKDPDKTVIWFVPPTEEQYGMVQLGWYFEEDRISYQGGMNEYGLCYDSTAIPDIELNDKPDATYNPSNSYKWRDIIGLNKTVDEAVGYIKDYNFGTMWFQLFLTDATGKTVVVSPGKDGELVFDYMNPEVGFMIQTNFNRSNPVSRFGSYPDPRYDAGFNALNEAVGEGNVNVREFESILEITSQKSHEAYTPYSNIFDPVNKKVYIYYATQFDEAVYFDLLEELQKGEHEFLLSELVLEQTHANGLLYHENFMGKRLRFTIMAIFGVIAVVIVVSVISFYLGKRRRRKLAKKKL